MPRIACHCYFCFVFTVHHSARVATCLEILLFQRQKPFLEEVLEVYKAMFGDQLALAWIVKTGLYLNFGAQ